MTRPPASPHTRGWTPRRHGNAEPGLVFPAHAGMDPAAALPSPRAAGLPRTRGDGPRETPWRRLSSGASPHTRGWTALQPLPRARHLGFPAHAGMDRARGTCSDAQTGLPRTRGDGPCPSSRGRSPQLASPHTRGWTPTAPPPRRRTRGFPAHAGMDRRSLARRGGARGLPRTRGDGPALRKTTRVLDAASPHTRGWTGARRAAGRRHGGFPAHAGMDPTVTGSVACTCGLPRTRGDGPWSETQRRIVSAASPHTRGWTRPARRGPRRAAGFPAHAGMDPATRSPCP